MRRIDEAHAESVLVRFEIGGPLDLLRRCREHFAYPRQFRLQPTIERRLLVEAPLVMDRRTKRYRYQPFLVGGPGRIRGRQCASFVRLVMMESVIGGGKSIGTDAGVAGMILADRRDLDLRRHGSIDRWRGVEAKHERLTTQPIGGLSTLLVDLTLNFYVGIAGLRTDWRRAGPLRFPLSDGLPFRGDQPAGTLGGPMRTAVRISLEQLPVPRKLHALLGVASLQVVAFEKVAPFAAPAQAAGFKESRAQLDLRLKGGMDDGGHRLDLRRDLAVEFLKAS